MIAIESQVKGRLEFRTSWKSFFELMGIYERSSIVAIKLSHLSFLSIAACVSKIYMYIFSSPMMSVSKT